MSKNKMKQCSSCGAEIAASAKICPRCGANNKKPIYKRAWFIILIVLIIIIAVAGNQGGSSSDKNSSSNGTTPTAEQDITYTAYTVQQLLDDLDANAMKAADTYEDMYVELEGRLGTIDSSGAYISLLPENNPWAINGIHCRIKSDDQKNAIMEMKSDDIIVVKGQITDVGEILGYSLNMDSVSKK